MVASGEVRTLKNESDTIRVLLRDAKVLTSKKEYEEALGKYSQVLEIDSELVIAWYFKTILHKKLGQDDDAAQCGQRVVELDPKWMSKITAILDSTEESQQKKPSIERTRTSWTREDEILDRFHKALFIDCREVFEDTWEHPMTPRLSLSRQNRKRVIHLLDLLSESVNVEERIVKKVFDYTLDALLKGYTFFIDDITLINKFSHTLNAIGFRADEKRFGHISRDLNMQTLASVFCSFIERIEENTGILLIEHGVVSAQPSWFSRHGMLALTSKNFYAVGSLGFKSGPKTSVEYMNSPWKPYHRYVDVYPLEMLRGCEITGDFLFLEFDQLWFKLHREVEKYKAGRIPKFQTEIETDMRKGKLSLRLQFQYDDEEKRKERIEGFSKLVESSIDLS